MVELQEKLYKIVLKEKTLTTKALNNGGINARDIQKLIQSGELLRVQRGVYALTDVKPLYSYARWLCHEKKYEEAQEYFLKCYELAPNHIGTNFQLLFWDIERENYDSALKYIDNSLKSENKYFINDINYYLYLLSFVIELPEHLQKRVKGFTENDIIVFSDDNRYVDFRGYTKSRKIAFSQSFINASKVLNALIKTNRRIGQKEIIERKLLDKAVHARSDLNAKRRQYLQERQYEILLKDLRNESLNHNLSKLNSYLALILTDYLEIEKTSIIPMYSNLSLDELSSKDAVFLAIKHRNYSLALELSMQYNYTVESQNTNLIHIMLKDMVALIENIKGNKEKDNKQEVDSTVLFSEIVNSLLEKNVDEAISKLHSYLVSIGKEQYEFLIVDLIKISALEQDSSFSKPMLTLTNMRNDEFTLDTMGYVQEFYSSVSKKRFEKARIYLDIINKSKDFGVSDELVASLNKTLDLLDKKKTTVVIDKKESDSLDITKDEDYIFLNEKFQQLSDEKGIIILDPMDSAQRKKMHKIVERFPNMTSFSIGEEKDRRIVLRYVASEWIEIDKVLSDVNKALKKKDYKKCVEGYLTIISGAKPKTSSFYKLGIYLNKAGLYKESIDYLTVAYELFKSNQYLRDDVSQMALQDLINKTKQKIEEPKKIIEVQPETKVQNNEKAVVQSIEPVVKPVVTVTQSVKTDTSSVPFTNEYFGITKIEEISIMVNDMEMPITEACTKCGLNEEETSIVRLIFARDCYTQGFFEKGDKLFKIVERSKDKSPRLKQAITDVRSNRPFYMYRDKKGPQLLKSLKFKN